MRIARKMFKTIHITVYILRYTKLDIYIMSYINEH